VSAEGKCQTNRILNLCSLFSIRISRPPTAMTTDYTGSKTCSKSEDSRGEIGRLKNRERQRRYRLKYVNSLITE